jgi:hypothetical protein
MKKFVAALFLATLFLTSCGEAKIEPKLQDLPQNYTLASAKADGCVVYEDLDITSGQESWDAFLASAQAEKSCAVRLYFYDTLNPDLYTEEHYHELLKEYPKIHVWDLSYHKGIYRLTKLVNGVPVTEEYPYLLKSEDEALLPSISGYSKRIVYFLSDTPEITWLEAIAPSAPDAETTAYRYERVYCDLIGK